MSYSPPALLPPGDEIEEQRRSGATFEAIGLRYGVSRQAAHQRWKRWDDARRSQIADELTQLSEEIGAP